MPFENSNYNGYPLANLGLDKLGKAFNDLTGTTASNKFNEYMASTEYQRAVQDLKSAGLNPSVLYGQGAGHSASSSSPAGSGVYNAIGGTINSLIHSAVELHEDARSNKNKNIAFHTAMNMIERELKGLRNSASAISRKLYKN